MDPHTIKLLEFSSVLQELVDSCFCAQGKKRIRSEEILTEPDEVQERLKLAVEFRRILESGRSFHLLDFPDIGSLIPAFSKTGTQFDEDELSRLGRFIVSAGRLRRHILRNAVKTEQSSRSKNITLSSIASCIPELKALAKEIFTLVDREGNLKDRNIPVLRDIKSRIKNSQKQIERLAREYLSNTEYRSFWQTDNPTQRDGRTVLPLKSNFKGRIRGIIHEVSASGATIYLEPLDIVEKNNEIVEQQNRYRMEARRILRELSFKVVASAEDLTAMVEAVSELDALYARAVYAIKQKCTPAEIYKSSIALNQARHPLLGKEAVPITLSLGGDSRVLIITGPNTGGKTVTLKTVGLLALMNQFGMEIPVEEGSSLCVFDRILADIGDEQSIEQSLSTFSGHIVNITRIIESSTDRSLVLFDELGAGTDPEEGVAMAMSLLDHFISKGCLTLATTHHGILKNYGYSRPGVENASMEFNQEDLKPTFHIIMGIPGESHALEIARRSGIPEIIVHNAEAYLRDERSDISELIKRLSKKQRELIDAEKEQKSRESRLHKKTRETDLKELRIRQKEMELREHGMIDMKRFLKESRRELERIIREIREGELTEEKILMIRDHHRRLESRVQEEEEKLERERKTLYKEPDYVLREGMEVIFKGGKRGRILRKGKGNSWIVETDTLRGEFRLEDIEPAEGNGEKENKVSILKDLVSRDLPLQLDIRGLRLEEAIRRLQQQLDEAIIQGLREFTVVHGKGDGILQQGVHSYLGQCEWVKDYYFSRPEEGGFGKTIVKL